MPKLNIDGTEYEFENGTTLIEACAQVGISIPRFCYHERLSIAGNCRMCLVEVVGGPPKPQASCAMTVNDLRPGRNGEPPAILTKSEMVKKAREGVMEFLLVNHPLDCPICDQGGECDLQDQAMAFGFDSSRYKENKRAVEEKYLGPLVKTSMTRCIQCTRCVRFMTEVAGVEELGAIGRGEDMEITTYLEAGLGSELQANVIDLCPVGALTSRPTAFHARPWEFRKTETVDVMDALGSSIRVDSRGREVVRILPRANDQINEEWISDKTRFVADGLKTQRLDRPYVREGGRLRPASWEEALGVVAARLKAADPKRIGAIAGDLAAAEEMFALKGLMQGLGVRNIDCRQDGAALDPSLGRDTYLFNATIEGLEEADAILIVGANPRLEAPVLNQRLRKRWRAGEAQIGLIGEAADLTFRYEHLGVGAQTLGEVAAGRHSFADTLKAAKRPVMVLGQAAIRLPDGRQVLALAARAAVALGLVGRSDGWNGFCVLHTAAARVAGLDLGLVPGTGGLDVAGMVAAAGKGGLDVLFLLGADEIDTGRLGETFVVYLGSHGDAGAHRADVVLPGAAYTEKNGTYVNTEGRAQLGARAVFPPGDAKEDWAVIRALSGALGAALPYDNLAELRQAMHAAVPTLAAIDEVADHGSAGIARLAGEGGSPEGKAFGAAIGNFYLTNPIARASAVMAEMSAFREGRKALSAAE
ncbi:MAG: NADH-quinone oxidoreductase subunit NuoG [Hyphomicrobiaceae bacterium]